MSRDVMGVFGEVPNWSPYVVALGMSLIGRLFEEVYKKPQRCGYGTQS
jgi:hypothetical protein